MAYLGNGTHRLFLALSLLVSVCALGQESDCAADWIVVLLSAVEICSGVHSAIFHNGLQLTWATLASAITYFTLRMSLREARIASPFLSFIAAGGALLAFGQLWEFEASFAHLTDHFPDQIVAFRSRLLFPPTPWVLGEWLTLVLLTLPFGAALFIQIWLSGQRRLALPSVALLVLVLSVLFLSCSRAIGLSVGVFVLAAAALGAGYRIIQWRESLACVAAAFTLVLSIVLIEDARYPGVGSVYLGSHTSQTRSTEGRLSIWKRSTEVFLSAPAFGVGNGNAPLYLAATGRADDTTGFASRTFSLPIQIITEKGAVGAALYIALLVLVGWEAHRKLRRPTVALPAKGVTCCLVAGVIAVLFRELTYSSLLEHAVTTMLFAMMLALIVNPEPDCAASS